MFPPPQWETYSIHHSTADITNPSPHSFSLSLHSLGVFLTALGDYHQLTSVGTQNETYLSFLEAGRRWGGRLKLGREGLRSLKNAKQGEFEKLIHISDFISKMTGDPPL